ncbi:hypothetical protein RRG08_009828 [Elysia crispata]|uniref:Uncharacterized protein n=1 Tax=Elysia crispata TaxID=231223 RepID=A0AAE0Z446_9GAST|nr:hypothetical protein RRG08_009828 [Elysia crispata]
MDNRKLSLAIIMANVNRVKSLLESGRCSINEPGLAFCLPIIACVNHPPLHYSKNNDAARRKILKVLVAHCAHLNIQSENNGKTAAIVAAENGFLKCLQFLVQAGADLSLTSQRGKTALIAAAKASHYKCVECLIHHTGAELNVEDADGYTALMWALEREIVLQLCLRC